MPGPPPSPQAMTESRQVRQVPKGRPTIAHRFIGGCIIRQTGSGESRQGRKNFRRNAMPSCLARDQRRRPFFRPLRGSGQETRGDRVAPAMNRRAILDRPCRDEATHEAHRSGSLILGPSTARSTIGRRSAVDSSVGRRLRGRAAGGVARRLAGRWPATDRLPGSDGAERRGRERRRCRRAAARRRRPVRLRRR